MNNLKILISIFFVLLLFSCSNSGENVAELKTKIQELEAKVKAFEDEKALVAKNIALYDKMDLVAFNDHDMETISQIHSDDVKVINPDGSLVDGMNPAHRDQLQWMFDSFSDIKVESHPVKFGSGNWTAGMGATTGTFDRPMKLPNGKVIQPTGKKFSVNICTLVLWENGRIKKEYLFWDQDSWNKQIGVQL